VRRSEFVELLTSTTVPMRTVLEAAEAAGARWEPEPEPAAELPTEASGRLWDLFHEALEPDILSPREPTVMRKLLAAVASVWPRWQPAGPGRERRLAVPLVMTSVEGAIWDGNGNLVLDASLGWERREKIGSLKTTNPDTLSELVNHYNAPLAPAGWPAPRLGREGLPEKGMVLWWSTVEWVSLHAGSIDPNDWWLPQPPPPPEAP
jgi:hypothetical protein